MAKHRAVNLGKCKLTLSLAIQLMLYSFTFGEVTETELRASHVLGKCSTWLISSPRFLLLFCFLDQVLPCSSSWP